MKDSWWSGAKHGLRLATGSSRRVSLIVACAVGLSACGNKGEPKPGQKKAPDQADSVRALAEGPDAIFGLKLPPGSTIVRSGVDSNSVQVPHPMDAVTNYLRARLEAKSVDVGPRSTVFRRAKLVDGTPGILEVTVTRAGSGTKLSILRRYDPKLDPPVIPTGPLPTVRAPDDPLPPPPPTEVPPPPEPDDD